MISLWIATLVLVANGLGQDSATPQTATSPTGVTIRERVVVSADMADSPHVEPRLASDRNDAIER